MFQVRAHDDLVIIVHRSTIAALRVDDRDTAVVFALHVFIAEAKLAKKFYAAYFEPDEMIRVIDDAHLVGFSIADADASFADCCLPIQLSIQRTSHRPVHFGLRFSRNDSMPSRKSSLSRIPAFSRTAASICESSSARAWSVSSRLVLESDRGLFSDNCAASWPARSSNFSGGTISLSKPSLRASAASKIRPVRSRSRAIFSPTWRKRKVETIAGTNPMRTSV